MDDIITKFPYKTCIIEIQRDPEPLNPRTEWDDPLVTLVHWHRRLNLCDDRIEHMTEEELRASVPDIVALLPLYLLDHSGQTMNTTGFACRWDSGQVGWGYVTKEDQENAECADWSEEKLKEAIVAAVETYDKYLRGEVYGYVVKDSTGEEIEACWGYFDIEEAKDAAKGVVPDVSPV